MKGHKQFFGKTFDRDELERLKQLRCVKDDDMDRLCATWQRDLFLFMCLTRFYYIVTFRSGDAIDLDLDQGQIFNMAF